MCRWLPQTHRADAQAGCNLLPQLPPERAEAGERQRGEERWDRRGRDDRLLRRFMEACVRMCGGMSTGMLNVKRLACCGYGSFIRILYAL